MKRAQRGWRQAGRAATHSRNTPGKRFKLPRPIPLAAPCTDCPFDRRPRNRIRRFSTNQSESQRFRTPPPHLLITATLFKLVSLRRLMPFATAIRNRDFLPRCCRGFASVRRVASSGSPGLDLLRKTARPMHPWLLPENNDGNVTIGAVAYFCSQLLFQ